MRSILVALIAVPAIASAQDHLLPRAPNVFLEKAYFSLGTPTGKELLFEGQPTVHYYFANGLGNAVWQKNGGGTWAFPVSAMLQVRMSRSYSMPVKTPSYRIRPLYAQYFHLTRPQHDPLAFVLREFGLALTHYSNGQRGCTYQGFTFDAVAEACTVSNASLAAQRRTNTEDGDFSTTYIAADVKYRRGKLHGADDPVASNWTVGAEVQVHPIEFPVGGMNGDQSRDWGQHQLTLMAESERRLKFGRDGVFRVAAEYIYRKPATPGRRTDSGQIEVSFMPDGWHQLGGFARVHVGSDYYNIRYQDRRPFMSLGVMWDLNRLDKLNTGLPN